GVVVEERHHVADRMGGSRVAAAGEPPATAVWDDHELRERDAGPCEQRRIVVDDEDGADRGAGLCPDGGHGADDVVPPSLGIGADHHREPEIDPGDWRPDPGARGQLATAAGHRCGQSGSGHPWIACPWRSVPMAVPSWFPQRSIAIVRRTRRPSENALRLLTPCSRSCSKLATSVTRRPALAIRTLMSVSTSNPPPPSRRSSSPSCDRPGSRPSNGRQPDQKALYP